MADNMQMEELSIKELTGKYNFIVPEIQREYVWGKNDGRILDTFFDDIQDHYGKSNDLNNTSFNTLQATLVPVLSANFTDNTLQLIATALERFETNRSMNIGFLYSYKPNYYVYNDISEDVYLIDGQQRFTTLFLALFYFSVKENKLGEFKDMFRVKADKERIGFDYRVRNLTHYFIIDLIANTKEGSSDLDTISNKTWFLSEYDKDVSVQAMLGTLTKLTKKYNSNGNLYFSFLANQVKFWHFKTEETNQGEELYITMNSRGKPLSGNEILRAKLFEAVDKNKIRLQGQLWEQWQDFFWQNKGQNINSDNGFNEFLRWVQILTMINGKNIDPSNEDEESNDKKEIVRIIKWEEEELKINSEYLSLPGIGLYFEAVKYLFQIFSPETLHDSYGDCLDINMVPQQWLSLEQKKVLIQIECFRLLPVIEYCKILLQKGDKPNGQDLYRVIRYFYTLKDVDNVSKAANVSCINGVKLIGDLLRTGSKDIADIKDLKGISKTLLTEEEKYKFNLFKASADREALEREFWKAENHKLNSGRIGHLLQGCFEDIDTIDNFKYDSTFAAPRAKKFELPAFISLSEKFFRLIPDVESKSISGKLWGYFLPTSYYSISKYAEKYEIVTCQITDNQALVSKEFLRMVFEIGKGQTEQDYFKGRSDKFFGEYKSSSDLKDEKDLKKQLFTYFSLLSVIGGWDWGKGKNFGKYDKEPEGTFKGLFEQNFQCQQYKQKWGGAAWRNVNLSALEDGRDYLQMIIDRKI